jgi:hypothetical protein
MAYAYEQAAESRKPPERTPSLVSGSILESFALRATGEFMVPPVATTATLRGFCRLDRMTQTIDYTLVLAGRLQEEILDIRLHRGAVGSNGPIVALLGKELRGSLAVANRYLTSLLKGEMYLVVYTRSHPRGEIRGQLTLELR